MSPASQCLPTTRARTGGALRGPRGERAGVVRVVQRGADVVAHPAVDRDVGAPGAAVEGDLLDRADLVDGAHRRADDRAAGLDGQAGHVDAERAALVLDDLGQLGGELGGVAGVVLGGVGDAEAAAEVHLGHLHAELLADPRVQGQHPAGRDLEAGGVEDLAADVAVQAEQAQPGAASTRRTASKASPEEIEKPNFWSSCAVAMYSWVCASTPAVTRIITPTVRRAAAVTSASRSTSSNESTMTRPTPSSHGPLELAAGLVVAVEADALHREAGPLGDGQLAAGADVEVQALLGQPPDGGRGEERLAGVEDVVRRRTRRRRPGPARGSRARPGRTPGCRARRPGRAAPLPRR